MNPLLMNSGDYNIEAENACASLLSQFNSNFIFDICTRALEVKDAPMIIESPNIVNSAEITFNDLKQQFPVDVENIMVVRNRTHLEIIDRLCTYYHAQFIDPGEEYHFILAKNMYYFLACGYVRCLIKFMSAHIYKNRMELYDVLNMNEAKKNKDTSTIYNKKIYKNDSKLALIIANLHEVINYVLGMDISFEEILKYIFMDDDMVDLIYSSFKFQFEFFDYYKATMNREVYRPSIESNINLQLMSHYANAINI